MVAIGRAMMSNPVILMLDEPSLGLSPLLSKELFQTLKAVRAAGLGILLVEQNAKLSLGIADRGYLLENGRILREDRADVLIRDPAVQAAYLGGASGHAAAPAGVAAAQHPAAHPAPAADLPPPVTIRARPPRSVSASDMVGFDIDALVAGAGAKARPAAPARPATLTPGMAEAALAARSDRLSQALSEIEAAATRARERGRLPTAPLPPLRPMGARPLPAQTPPITAPAPAVTPPASAGRVEVWRRRPGSTQFDRTEV
jgi:branched-chain amino acid transport system ATP-binding protein